MLDISISYSVNLPVEASPTINTDEYHPAAIITSENTPISPNMVLAMLAAHDDVPTKSLQEIITGLVATIKLREMAWEADRVTMRACINHAEDRLEAALEEREDNPDFEFGSVPVDFEHNKGRVPHFDIPVGDSMFLPTAFIQRDMNTYKKVWEVTGRFGKEKPQYAIEIFTNPANDSGIPTEPLRLWFVHLLQGRTSNYKFLCDAAINLGDWGITADITRYHEYEDQLHKLNASILAMRVEAKALDVLQESCRNHLAATNASHRLAQLEGACQGCDCHFPIVRDATIQPLIAVVVDEDIQSEWRVMTLAPGNSSGTAVGPG